MKTRTLAYVISECRLSTPPLKPQTHTDLQEHYGRTFSAALVSWVVVQAQRDTGTSQPAWGSGWSPESLLLTLLPQAWAPQGRWPWQRLAVQMLQRKCSESPR